MGLMYQFPASLEEKDHVIKNQDSITLKTYGLPYIFWGYAAAIVGIVTAMYLAVRAPLLKLIELNSGGVDALIFYSLHACMLAVPVAILFYFFYEKNLIGQKKQLIIAHKFFGLTFTQKQYDLEENTPYYIDHFLDSPNMARIKSEEKMVGFQNKGYFELFARVKQASPILVDRHSRKVDLQKLIELLESVK